MRELRRRDFLGLAGAGALGFVAAACSKGSRNNGIPVPLIIATTTTTPQRPLPAPTHAPFDTVVVLMMENRSFDHLLGWMPYANGQQNGLSFVDAKGASHPTYRLTPDFQGCARHDPKHDWQSVAVQYDGGKCDGFLRTQPVGDTFPIGYYTGDDQPVLAALANGHTVCDHYFCSVLGPTGPNRMYAWSATTDYLEFDGALTQDGPRPSNVQLTIFDRLQAAGVSARYYAGKEPHSYAFKSKKYDAITRTHDEFFVAAASGTLPHVTYIDPDLDSVTETTGAAYDDHPYGDIRQGEAFIAKVYEALAQSPQWKRMVIVLTFDEHGGFYDHVPPPAVADDTVVPGSGPKPDLKRLGFRVPTIVMGPFAPGRIVSRGPYEHCSILKMIEWRWRLQPMTARDHGANNLAEVLDFTAHRRPLELPALHVGAPPQCTPAQIGKHITG